ncbi:hypothetical protein RF11_16048 [Thelohanellus kitauei]|uniref:Uncharacterized protein n=1 Tax=Thelohanellus kitauei TaxID=669202 RepID=A0A0C2IME4_THEKT|nr:hypothetical protein RF11_16048 [Thelohanellus kitauei]
MDNAFANLKCFEAGDFCTRIRKYKQCAHVKVKEDIRERSTNSDNVDIHSTGTIYITIDGVNCIYGHRIRRFQQDVDDWDNYICWFQLNIKVRGLEDISPRAHPLKRDLIVSSFPARDFQLL